MTEARCGSIRRPLDELQTELHQNEEEEHRNTALSQKGSSKILFLSLLVVSKSNYPSINEASFHLRLRNPLLI